jgi:flagellar basal-body rod protein FlgC
MKKYFKYFIFLLAFFFANNSFSGSLDSAMQTSASAMNAQSERIKVVTENIANTDTTGINPFEEPYRRKTIYFSQEKDKKTGAKLVQVKKIDRDKSDFKLVYQPEHPAANDEGYVRYPNVDRNLESMNLREAQRSYEANISAIEITKQMMDRSLDLMK